MSITTSNNLDSNKELKLISKHEYRSVLREHLPAETFKSDTKDLLRYFIFMSLYLFGIHILVNLQLFFQVQR